MPLSVQETVWNWRDSSRKSTGSRAANTLRRQATIQAVVMGVIGFVLYTWVGHVTFARIIWGLAGLVLILGLVAPTAYRPLHRFGQWLGKSVGLLLTYILLVPLYYLVFFPGALILRLQGRDPMHRKRRDLKYTCWIKRRQSATETNYQRQFLLEDKAARSELRLVGTDTDLKNDDDSTGQVQR